jgi:hypothetical protein
MIPFLLTGWALATQSPDSAARAEVNGAVITMGDALAGLRGASAMFRRDLEHASPQLLVSRAGVVREQCDAVSAAGARFDSAYARNARVVSRDRGMADVRRELRALQQELARCDREWRVGYQPAQIDSVRAWGPYRLARIETAVRRYHEAAGRLPYPKPKRTAPS